MLVKNGEHMQMPFVVSRPEYTENNTPYLTHPGVIVLAQPSTFLENLDSFLEGFASNFNDYVKDPVELQDGTQLCKVAGQLCYMSFGKHRTWNAAAADYFTNIKSSGHGSVLEHANYTFLLYGISRSLTHELVRHRLFSYSQISQRYVSGKMLRFVERPEYAGDVLLHSQFLKRIDQVAQDHKDTVERLLALQKSTEAATDKRKKVQQAARSLLPNETEAPLVVTGNVRAWRHFLEMRGSCHAEIEMRMLAYPIFLCLQQCATLLFDDYSLERLQDGTFEIKTAYKKV